MIVNILLGLGCVAGFLVASLTFMLNAETPVQPGPIPFFGGAILAFICFVALVARLVA